MANDAGLSTIKSGTEMYMSLYPEGSTDSQVPLGNIVPDFKAETTQGKWDSFHAWKQVGRAGRHTAESCRVVLRQDLW